MATKINIGDVWKDVPAIKINIGDVWKNVSNGYINIGNTWKKFYTASNIAWQNYSILSPNGWKSSTPNIWSHTITGGTNRYVFVYTMNTNKSTTVRSISYGGIAMTQLKNISTPYRFNVWGLKNPQIGTSTIRATFNTTTTGNVWMGAASYTGVNQTTPIDTINFEYVPLTGTLTTHTGSTYVSGSTSWVVGAGVYESSGVQESWNKLIKRDPSNAMLTEFYDSNGVVPSGTYTVTGTSSTAQQVAFWLISLISA